MARLLALLAVMAMLVVVGCGGDDNESSGGGGGTGTSSSSSDQPGAGKPAVTIGTKDFTEEFVLGQLYKQALEAKGYKVNYKENIGATEIIDKALTSKQIDAYPEYTGVSQSVVFKQDALSKSPEETQKIVKDVYEKRGRGGERPDAVPGHRRDRHDEGVRREEQPQLGGRPQGHPWHVHARRAAGVQEPLQRPQGHGRRSTASRTTSSSSSSRSACSTRRSTRATSTRRTCSRPTRSWPRASTRCWRTRRASSASRTSTSSSTRTSSTRSAAMTSWTSSTRSTSC